MFKYLVVVHTYIQEIQPELVRKGAFSFANANFYFSKIMLIFHSKYGGPWYEQGLRADF